MPSFNVLLPVIGRRYTTLSFKRYDNDTMSYMLTNGEIVPPPYTPTKVGPPPGYTVVAYILVADAANDGIVSYEVAQQ